MHSALFFILPIIAYLLGSFSSAVWFGKWFKGVDLREFGSKNAGATNAFRVLGAKIAIPVFLTDVLKGFISVSLVYLLKLEPHSETFCLLSILLGICAVIGHVFPVYTGFKGGKGVATMLGMLIALNPIVALCCFGVFVVVFASTRIVSIASMAASIAFPVFILFIFDVKSISLSVFSLLAAIVVIVLHHKNIKRLIIGQEKKISFSKK